MSRINSALIVFLIFVFFSGCSARSGVETVSTDTVQEKKTYESSKIIHNSTEGFSEAAIFMSAIDSMDNREYEQAAVYLNALYAQTGKKRYLVELVKINSAMGEFEKAKELLLTAIKEDDNDIDSKKMLAANYIGQKDYKAALEVAESICAKTKQKEDYDTAGSIAYVIGDYKIAQKYFRMSYAIKADHASADRIATVMFLEGKTKEATGFLEMHVRMFGCSKYLCERLATAYIERNDQRGALETYKKLYFKIKDEKYIKKIIELSVAGNDIDGLIRFLKKSQKDDNLLLEAYKYKKDSKNAAALSMKLYEKTKDMNYLAQATIYKFESYPEKKPLWLIKESIKNLTLVTSSIQNDVYDNYLGYLMIDYDISLDKGVELVKRALTKDPTSLFYKDSLAWGYYKQKKCAEASEIMKPVAAELKDDKTVQEHMNMITKCLQGQK